MAFWTSGIGSGVNMFRKGWIRICILWIRIRNPDDTVTYHKYNVEVKNNSVRTVLLYLQFSLCAVCIKNGRDNVMLCSPPALWPERGFSTDWTGWQKQWREKKVSPVQLHKTSDDLLYIKKIHKCLKCPGLGTMW